MTTLDAKQRAHLAKGSFAFPKQRKEPLEDAEHVRNAIARFTQVGGVTNADRDVAWRKIKRAAKEFGVEISEGSWRDLVKAKTEGKAEPKSEPRTKAASKSAG